MSDARDDIIDLFRERNLPYKGSAFRTKEEESEESKKERTKKFFEYIDNESKHISYELFIKYVNFEVPTVLAKKLFKTKNKNKNNELINVAKSGLSDLKDEIKEMSKEEIENKKPDEILKIVEEILNFNTKIKKQQGFGLKILTPDQMLSRLPITLAQLKAGNNSEKLKNEIRQLLYSLFLCTDQKNLQTNSIKV